MWARLSYFMLLHLVSAIINYAIYASTNDTTANDAGVGRPATNDATNENTIANCAYGDGAIADAPAINNVADVIINDTTTNGTHH